MAFSSNPAVREVQNGVGFAFRPIQGALDEVAGGVAVGRRPRSPRSTGCASTTPRSRAENERLAAENARLEEIRRENDALTGAPPAPGGLRLQDGRAPVIARESSEFRRLVALDKGTDDGIEVGDVVVAAGGALAGRVDRGRAGQRQGRRCSPTASSTVIGQLDDERGDRRGRRPARRRPDHAPDRLGRDGRGRRRGRHGRHRARRRRPLAVSRRACSSARSSTSGATPTTSSRPRSSSPAADLDKLEYVLVITDYEGGLPPIEQQPVDCGGERRRCPRASSRASRRARRRRRPRATPKP